MLELIAKVIPLDVAMMFSSPMYFALALIFLGSPVHPKLRTMCFAIGSLLVGAGIMIAGFVVGGAATPGDGPSVVSASIDLALGVFFIVIGIRTIAAKDRQRKFDPSKMRHILLGSLVLGALASIIDFDTLPIVFAAGKEVGTSSVEAIWKVIVLVFNLFCFSLPVTFPLFLTLIFPKTTAGLLGKLNRWIMKYSKYILLIIFFGFGAWLVYSGLQFFWR